MSLQRALAVLVGIVSLSSAAVAQEVPRDQNLIAENPNGTIANPDWFNIWTPAGSRNQPTGLHQLTMDTFWYIDPDHGLDQCRVCLDARP